MKVVVEIVDSKEKEEAVIKATELTDSVKGAVDLLENGQKSIPVLENGKTMLCKTSSIYYIESVDKKTYIYTKDGCYETKYRLYELDEMLGNLYCRCSKAMIINLRKIKNVRSEIGGRLFATLLNDEKVVISRSYVKTIKERLDI